MTTCSVIDKLLAANAIQLREENKEPTFTTQFQNYVSIYAGFNREGLRFIQGWRQMLAGFHLSLLALTDEELSTIVRLLEYQVEATKSYTVSS